MLQIRMLDMTTKSPSKAYEGDAGIDFYSPLDFSVAPRSFLELKTKVTANIPEGYWLGIYTKSSVAKQGVMMHLGVID